MYGGIWVPRRNTYLPVVDHHGGQDVYVPASAVVQLSLDVDARANRVDVQGKRDEHRLGALQVVEPAVRHGTRVFELRLFTKRVSL
jgi:hypothetical protein